MTYFVVEEASLWKHVGFLKTATIRTTRSNLVFITARIAVFLDKSLGYNHTLILCFKFDYKMLL